ncbi:ABC transporter permease [Shivajiella indica]|uniref:ABC transporter permease n=1 Tax=Shivajiella indica TaxID=872115 RepID=A0ABW5B461_9BACT
MLSNYLKIFLRNLKKNPAYILINILGLAVGMAASLLILMFVHHELSYEDFHEKKDRIYRVSRAFMNQEGEVNLHLGHAAPPFGPLLKSDFSKEIEESVRLMNINILIKNGSDVFEEERFFFADPEVFNVFSWEVLKGNPQTALSSPDGLVLTEEMARKYFGQTDVLGKSLEVMVGSVRFDVQVTGVMKNIPDNSHLQPDFLASMEPVINFYGGYESMMRNYGSNNFSTYLLLNDGIKPGELEKQIPSFLDRHISESSSGVKASTWTKLQFWPLSSIHLHSNLDSEVQPNSSIEYVYIYSAIAIFILLIACVNFMNLATARSAKRAMEVGLRKVMGADKSVLIRQFMGETIMMTLFGLLIALLLVFLTIPSFSDFTNKDLNMEMLAQGRYIIMILGMVLLVGLVAGSYPSLFLSGFQPVKVLKGTYKIGSIHEKFRSMLVVGQFAISIMLIVAVLVVLNQLDYMKNKDLGFDKESLVILPSYTELTDNYEILRERYLSHPGITEMALGSRVPSGRLLDSQGAQAEVRGELTSLDVRISDVHVSHTFFKTFGIEFASGRDFDYRLASDSLQAFILNESAVRAIGWANPEEAIDKQFTYGNRRGYVVGVTKDFHFESLHQPISPMVFLIPDERFNSVAFKIKEDQKEEVLAYLKEEWQALRPDFPFNYYTVEDRFAQQYEAEEKVGAVFGFFAGLAILISILGLFGLSAYATEQRVKEIGIRKVMGASVGSILLLLGKDFLKLVLFGFLIAVPIAWFGMSKWLENFAYSISVSWLIFILAGLSAMLVAALTVSSQTIRAALINPVDSMKVE